MRVLQHLCKSRSTLPTEHTVHLIRHCGLLSSAIVLVLLLSCLPARCDDYVTSVQSLKADPAPPGLTNEAMGIVADVSIIVLVDKNANETWLRVIDPDTKQERATDVGTA